MSESVHRWRVLAASVVIVMCTGIIYSFSVFAGPLQDAHGWTTAQVMLAFAISGALAPVPMVLGGIVLDRGGARALMIAGAVLFGAGFALTGTASTPFQLCLWYGVVTACGVGLCYTTAVSNTVKLFPDRQGLAAGLITAGVGAGTVIGAPVARVMIETAGVSAAFVRMGLVYGVIALAAATFVRSAPTASDGAAGATAAGAAGVPWHRMVRSGTFPVIFLLFAATLFAPLMVVSQLSGIGQSQWYGLSAATAALFVSAFAACKAIGGPVWGVVADRYGAATALALMSIVSAGSLVAMLSWHSVGGFVIGVIGIGSCFGGVMGVFPALTMTTFGARFQGVNYAVMFFAYSVSSFVGPRVAATAGDAYTAPFVTAIAVSLVGLALSVALRRQRCAPGAGPSPHKLSPASTRMSVAVAAGDVDDRTVVHQGGTS